MVMPMLMTMLVGGQIAEMIPTIAQLRITSFKGYPYLYNGTLESEYEYLETYKNNEHALVVYGDDPRKGLMQGAPLTAIFPSATPIFEAAQLNPEYFYYCEEIILPLDKMTLILQMFAAVEDQAKKWGYKNVCLITHKGQENHSLKPDNYQSVEPLFEKIGFIKTHLSMQDTYSTFCQDGSVQQREHEFVFWIKKLN